jgi:ribose transport system ATP-binding protein
MGANGAGKSTFIKVLTGALSPDAGTFRVGGRDFRASTPAAARRAGLLPVYQEPSLIPDLSLGENLRLGGTDAPAFLAWAEELGVGRPALDVRARDLPLATLRVLDLARALAAKPDVLILDEMTAALPGDLVERVLRAVRGQAERGGAVVYISHRFAEIAAVCHRATILRDGATVGDLPIEEGVEERAVELMLGARLGGAVAAAGVARPSGLPRLRVRGPRGRSQARPGRLRAAAGRGSGRRGLEGQGQDELFEALGGLRRATGGVIEVEGARKVFRHPADAIAAGLSLVPGDRRTPSSWCAPCARTSPCRASPAPAAGAPRGCARRRRGSAPPSSGSRSTPARKGRCAACRGATSKR